MKRLLVVLLLIASFVSAQDLKYLRYDTDLLSAQFHKNRREEVRKRLPENSAAVIFSAPERNRSNDDDYQYHQSPNFYYLTGNPEPDAMLIITTNEIEVNGKKSNEFLFVQRRNPYKETWTGRRLGIEGAQQLLGFDAVFITGEFKEADIDIKKFSSVLVLPWEPTGVVHDVLDQDDLWTLIEDFKSKATTLDSTQLNDILRGLRENKQPEEIKLLKKAIDISCDAHNEMMRTTKPGMYEYEVQATGEYIFKKEGSEYVGYPSICGGGENSVILHYESNRGKLSSGDLILLDMGAEYHGYSRSEERR